MTTEAAVYILGFLLGVFVGFCWGMCIADVRGRK